MRRGRARPPIGPWRLVGVGAGVLLVTLATGGRGPVTGSLEAFLKPPPSGVGVPLSDTALPEVSAITGTMEVKRAPSPAESATGVASSSVTWADIPGAALHAYRTAELVLRQTAPGCNLTWEVLAGIGRVESDHGRYGGATVSDDGIAYPPIYGVALDGTGDVAEIGDTDNGALDGDPVWDRAVGPMQFLPSTWDVVGVDADDDGVANPHDLDDAALAAGVYLCAGDVDLSDPAQLREALWRYNPSAAYGALVRSYIEAYRQGEPGPDTMPDHAPVSDVPSPTHPPTQPSRPPLSAAFSAIPVPNPHGPQGEVFADVPLPGQPHGPHPSPNLPVDWPHPPVNIPPVDPSDGPGDPSDGDGTPQQPQPGDPTSPPDDQPSTDPTPDPTDPTPDPTDPAPDPDDPTPTDPSTPTPTDPGTPSDTDNGSTPPAPTDSDPTPALTAISGVLRHTEAGWCVDTTVLYLGPDDYVTGTQATADYDGDGTTETIAVELEGLAGSQVSLEVRTTETSTDVYTIQGLSYRPTDGSPAPWESA
jgi:hypothetical protein